MIGELLKTEMQKTGCRASIVKLERMDELRKDMAELNRIGYVDENLSSWLDGFYRFTPPESEYDIASIIIIASASPQARVVFALNGKSVPLIMPPTYLDFISKPREIEKQLGEIFSTSDAHFIEAGNLPNKLLAARSGLGAYGRNNLVYVPGFGSLILLSAFYSDLSVDDDDWDEIRIMKYCERCSICRNHCPTGAITKDRFTVKGERCITYHNEFWGKPQFPDWIKPTFHNSIVGCMFCQRACPQNKEYLSNIVDITSFDEDETKDILARKEATDLEEALKRKLEMANLYVHYNYLARNLKALLEPDQGN
jgi:epoxyqueuosine reductase